MSGIPSPSTAISRQFDARAGSYEAVYNKNVARSLWHHEKRRRARWTVQWLARPGRLPDNPRILDVGCGDGFVTCQLAESIDAAIVQGTDVSTGMLERARNRAALALPTGSLEFSVGHGQDLPGRWDAIVALGVAGYQEDPLSFLSGWAERLAPRGWLIATLGNPYSLLRIMRATGRRVREKMGADGGVPFQACSSRHVCRQLEEHGCSLVERRYLSFSLGVGESSWEARWSHHWENVAGRSRAASILWAQTEWLVWQKK